MNNFKVDGLTRALTRQLATKGGYAQTLILVTFLLVNVFGFSVITRDHGSFEGRHLVEMNPTSLPELSKPSRDLLELRKTKILETNIFRETETN